MSCVALLLAQEAEGAVTLTTAGAVLMTLSVGLVLGLNVFCMTRILCEKRPQKHQHAPLEVDVTRDAAPPVRCLNPDCRSLNDAQAEFCAHCGRPLPGHNV